MSGRLPVSESAEWLEADGLGGFASGTTIGLRTRRYHALLLAAADPPTGRMVLVNGLDAWVEIGDGSGGEREYLTRQRYAPDVVAPDAPAEIESFDTNPWPTWIYRLRDGTRIEHELFVPRGHSVVALRWRMLGERRPVRLEVRPFLSGRDYHSLHHENGAFGFEPDANGDRLSWAPYPGVPRVDAVSNGAYRSEPEWYRSFLYAEEQARGLDSEEDLAAPGVLAWELADRDAVLILGTAGAIPDSGALETFARLRHAEHGRRARLGSGLMRAAEAYLVRRGGGSTIVAGYPWFTDWGRDTFIALRGLCLATGRLAEARAILLEWAGQVSDGMLPNRFADRGDAPEFNSVDASLWYVVAVHDYLRAAEAGGGKVPEEDRRAFAGAVTSIVAGYSRGTRYGIRLEPDGLLAAGEPGVQLTWMDAKVGDWVVTPRIGKPVEVQALWLNALRIAAEFTDAYRDTLQRGLASFNQRFRNLGNGHLHDVVDVDHRPGIVDRTLRPNQILAVGGLPYAVLNPKLAVQVVATVERKLWTPLGLRTLPQDDPRYVGHYEGGVRERDGGYHQGTVWPWLLGPFVEAWVRVHGDSASARREARSRFLDPLLAHLREAGMGHVSEIADAEPPHTPRGCPFQAWSVGEALRLDLVVLATQKRSRPAAGGADHAVAS